MWLLPTSYLFYIWQCIYVHATLLLRLSLPFPLTVSSSPFSMSASLFLYCPQVLQNHFFSFFQNPYICVSIRYLFFSLISFSFRMVSFYSFHVQFVFLPSVSLSLSSFLSRAFFKYVSFSPLSSILIKCTLSFLSLSSKSLTLFSLLYIFFLSLLFSGVFSDWLSTSLIYS